MSCASTRRDRTKPTTNMRLGSKISPFVIGTCLDMCPEVERTRRQREGSIMTVEREHASLPGQTLQQLMVKQYSRSATGDEVLQASEVRPPSVLLKTALYLCTHVLDLDQNRQSDPRWRDDRRKLSKRPSLVGDLEVFISDRFRMIEKDLAVQGFSASGFKVNHSAIRCFEMAVRYHLLMSYECRKASTADFDPVLNWTIMRNYASSLHNLYMHARRSCDEATAQLWCCNEDRMRSYIFLSRLPAPGTRGPEVQISIEAGIAMNIQTMLTQLAGQCPEVLQGPRVRAAINAIEAFCSNDYAAFFSLVRHERTDPLFLSALYSQFTRIRIRALNAVNRAYRGRFRTSTLVSLLGCNSGLEAMDICEAAGLQTRAKKHADVAPTNSVAAAIAERDVVLNHREKVYLREERHNQLKCLSLPAIDGEIQEHRRSSLVVGARFKDLRHPICVELKTDENSSFAFVFKEDRAKQRKRRPKKRGEVNKRVGVEVWCCFEPSVLAAIFASGGEEVLKLERSLASRLPSSALQRCRLKGSVLSASGVGNAALVMICESSANAHSVIKRIQMSGSTSEVVALSLASLVAALRTSVGLERSAVGAMQEVCRNAASPPIVTGKLLIGHHLLHILETMLSRSPDLLVRENTEAQLLAVALHCSSQNRERGVATRLDCPSGTRFLGESSWSCGVRCANAMFATELLDEDMCCALASEKVGNTVYFTCIIPG